MTSLVKRRLCNPHSTADYTPSSRHFPRSARASTLLASLISTPLCARRCESNLPARHPFQEWFHPLDSLWTRCSILPRQEWNHSRETYGNEGNLGVFDEDSFKFQLLMPAIRMWYQAQDWPGIGGSGAWKGSVSKKFFGIVPPLVEAGPRSSAQLVKAMLRRASPASVRVINKPVLSSEWPRPARKTARITPVDPKAVVLRKRERYKRWMSRGAERSVGMPSREEM